MTAFDDRLNTFRALKTWVAGGVLVFYCSLQVWALLMTFDPTHGRARLPGEDLLVALSLQHSPVLWVCGLVVVLTCVAYLLASDKG